MPTLQPPSTAFARLVYLAFGLMVIVVLLSAYLRLSGAGLGCADWPACYGQNYVDPTITKKASTPARLAHRLTATSLSLVILAIAVMAWRRRKQNPSQARAALLALGLTLFLSVLGIWTPGTRLPVIVLGNLLGGVGLLAVLWWLALTSRSHGTAKIEAHFRTSAWVGLIILFAQIALGGLVSANFAASACTSVSICITSLLKVWSLAAFNPWRELVVQGSGAIAIPMDAAAIHVTHWVTGVAVTIYLFWLGSKAITSDAAFGIGRALLSLAFLQGVLGLVAVKFSHPLVVVLTHNALAALLVLVLLSLAYRSGDHI